jgi:serine/threonine-protein kinase
MDDSSRGLRAARDEQVRLLSATQTDLTPHAFVARQADVFAVFDAATQDSGNVSYGATIGDQRFFIKTAGSPHDARALLPHGDRVALLRNAVRLARSVSDSALPALRNVIESNDGPLLVYDWADGELIGTPASRRSDPTSAFARFLALDTRERAAALDIVFRLHVKLAQRGWIACDFYDGSLIYDFVGRRMHVVDLDSYRDGPFTNEMGRMFGSSRFMAPEEHERGARIDERTTVFTMGRTVGQFLPLGTETVTSLISRACDPDPGRRFQTVASFYDAWSAATPSVADH